MANEDDGAREIARATQHALINAMLNVIAETKLEVGAPGLTWEQLEEFLRMFKNKDVTIIIQEHEA